MNDYWVDGHYIMADSEQEARAIAASLYGFTPDEARPWTDADQITN